MNKPKLIILDDYEGELAKAPAMTRLRELADVTILNQPLTPADDPLLRETDYLIALRERTQLDRAFFARCPNLKLLLQTGGHAYHVDQEAATAQGVIIALGRGRTTKPPIVVPELVFALLLGLIRQIYPLHKQMQRGAWPQLIGGSLHGRTLGILGYGRHGKPVARLAEAFGMKVIAWGRTTTGDNAVGTIDEYGVARVPLDEVLARADVVSVHLRLSESSKQILGYAEFKAMKPTAVLINTSRGALIDEAALIRALQEGEIAGAGLDVFAVEPLNACSPLRTLPNVLLTPHVGWQVQDVLHEFMAIATTQLEAWLAGQLPPVEVLNPQLLKI
ncbi:MAG TPA: D-2-hydroxyacid dehydrogenase family protein [Caldilineaceae bacterium]|nr:D-2-hydroxyacid dehydrogenase family protein [Caldilineaceae bacterium]